MLKFRSLGRTQWYTGLKDKIKKSAEEEEASGAAGVAFSPRETSLSVVRHRTDRDAAEESFFELLEAEVSPARNIPREARASGKGDAQVQQAYFSPGA